MGKPISREALLKTIENLSKTNEQLDDWRTERIAEIRSEARQRAFDEVIAVAKGEPIVGGIGIDAERTAYLAVAVFNRRIK